MNENLQNFLEKYYKKEESTIKTIEEKILKQKERENISLADYYFFQIKKEIKNILVNFYSEIDINEDDFNLEEPPFYIEGDFCFDCFLLAKKIKKLPKELSEEIARLINEDKEKIFIEEADVESSLGDWSVGFVDAMFLNEDAWFTPEFEDQLIDLKSYFLFLYTVLCFLSDKSYTLI